MLWDWKEGRREERREGGKEGRQGSRWAGGRKNYSIIFFHSFFVVLGYMKDLQITPKNNAVFSLRLIRQTGLQLDRICVSHNTHICMCISMYMYIYIIYI